MLSQPSTQSKDVKSLEREALEVRKRLERTFDDIQERMDPAYQLGSAFSVAKSTLSKGSFFSGSKFKVATMIASAVGMRKYPMLAAAGGLIILAIANKLTRKPNGDLKSNRQTIRDADASS